MTKVVLLDAEGALGTLGSVLTVLMDSGAFTVISGVLRKIVRSVAVGMDFA